MDLNLQINQMLKDEIEKKHEFKKRKKKEMNFCLTLCRGLDIFV
jgi:hypothetical protein